MDGGADSCYDCAGQGLDTTLRERCLMKPIRKQTLEELERCDWGKPAYNSYLVSTIHRLRRKPLEEFTTEDLRIMIGQGLGLPYLMPLAVERLQSDPLAQGDYYPGDLLNAVLTVEPSFWDCRADLYQEVERLRQRATALEEMTSEEASPVTSDE